MTCRAGARRKDRINPTGSLSVLFFEDDWLNIHSHVSESLLLAAATTLHQPPRSLPLPLSWHCWMLCLVHLQAVSPGLAALTDQPELHRSQEAFEVFFNQHRSCNELLLCGVGLGVGLCKCKCDQFENGLFFIQSSALGICTTLKIAVNQNYFCTFKLLLCQQLFSIINTIFKESSCFIAPLVLQ